MLLQKKKIKLFLLSFLPSFATYNPPYNNILNIIRGLIKVIPKTNKILFLFLHGDRRRTKYQVVYTTKEKNCKENTLP